MANGVRIEVKGAKELIRTLDLAPKRFHQAYKRRLGNIAEPTRLQAEHLALTRIRRMFDSPQWSGMRTVVGEWQALIVPASRGSRGTRRRPNLAGLLEQRALDPAAEANEKRVERELDQLADLLVAGIESDGP
jgi:hypothetical protein